MNRAAYFYRGIRRLVWAATVIWIGFCALLLIILPMVKTANTPPPAPVAAVEHQDSREWGKEAKTLDELSLEFSKRMVAPALPPGFVPMNQAYPPVTPPTLWEVANEGMRLTGILGLLAVAAAAVLLWVVRGFLPLDDPPSR